MSRLLIDPTALAAVAARYPALGEYRRVLANGLSVNTAACRFETTTGSWFAKRYDPRLRDPAGLSGEAAIVAHLTSQGFPTPALLTNDANEPLTWHDEAPYSVTALARGEDRYGDVPVFAPYRSAAEAHSAGATLAWFHSALRDGPPLAPRPFRGLTARFQVLLAPDLDAALDALWDEAPALPREWREALEAPWLKARMRDYARRLGPSAAALPTGLIHGDFIKRNLFWAGPHVSDVIDFDLWNVAPLVYDVALALLPVGFDWPRLLAAEGDVNHDAMRAWLAGYESRRPLGEAERAVLPSVMESARIEFYVSAALQARERGRPEEADTFWRLLVETQRWFATHPDWAAKGAWA